MIIIIKCKKSHPLGPLRNRKLLIFRACFGTVGLITFFFAFKLLDPSDCIAITHTSVIITSVLARIVLKEKLTFAHLIAILLTATGVILIAKPKAIFGKFTQYNQSLEINNCTINCSNSNLLESDRYFTPEVYTTIGILIALCCAFCSSTVQVLLKKLSTEKVHYSVVIIYVTYIGIPVTFLISLAMVLTGFSHKQFPKNLHLMPMQILYVTVGGALGVISQILLNLSLKYEQASKVAILRTLDVFLTFLFQYLFLNISVDIFSLIGSSSILLGTLLILSFKLIENRMKEVEKKKEKRNDGEMKKFSLFSNFIKFNF